VKRPRVMTPMGVLHLPVDVKVEGEGHGCSPLLPKNGGVPTYDSKSARGTPLWRMMDCRVPIRISR
jgi:hypothetical protein